MQYLHTKKMLLIGLLFFPYIVFAQHSIEGVWSPLRNPCMSGSIERDFSWGRRTISRHIDLVVDLHSEPPTIWIPQAHYPPDRIISFNEQGNVTELYIFSAERGSSFVAVFHFNEDGTMWIERSQYAHGYFWGAGEDYILHKVAGPEFD